MRQITKQQRTDLQRYFFRVNMRLNISPASHARQLIAVSHRVPLTRRPIHDLRIDLCDQRRIDPGERQQHVQSLELCRDVLGVRVRGLAIKSQRRACSE